MTPTASLSHPISNPQQTRIMETLSRLKPYYNNPPPPPFPLHPFPNQTPTRRARPLIIVSKLSTNHNLIGFHCVDHSTTLSRRIQPTLPRNTVIRSAVTTTEGDPSYSITEFQLSSRIRGICFYFLSAVFAIPLFLVMVLVHPITMLFDRHRRTAHHVIAKIWATLSVSPFYRYEFEGLENLPCKDTPAVYVSNHQSFMDIYTLLMLGMNFKFISKTSIFLIPVVGWAMFLMRLIPLRRDDSRSHLDCLKRCIDFVKKGASVFFFPEGTRSKDGKLGVFKKGAFSLAAKTEVPIVPITLLGTGKLMPPGMENILNSGSVKVVIHKPILGRDANMLCNEARSVIADALVRHGYGVC